jgi:hypothetical protein
MRGRTGFNVLAQNLHATKDFLGNRKNERQAKKMCWQCQKESSYEEGAYLSINRGLFKYICKPCMDAKREKKALKETEATENHT